MHSYVERYAHRSRGHAALAGLRTAARADLNIGPPSSAEGRSE
jgi:hypothetical protein